MNLEELHGELVRNLAKPGAHVRREMSDTGAHLVHMALGVAGETGELIDALKKSAIYRKPLDLDNVIEELGDIEFYLSGIRQCLGISREACLKENVEKLQRRYPSGSYSNQHAVERADKDGAQ